MYYKKFEHYIILCLIKQMTMILYVSGRPTDSEKNKLFTDDQLTMLASEVCSDLEAYFNATTCRENYWAPDTSMPKQASEVRIRCQSSENIRFQIKPSKSWQLVALVPHLTNDSKTDITYINYILIEPNAEHGDISTIPQRNYTIWSTKLKKGAPLMWQGGDKAPEYNKSMDPEPRSYDIKKYFFSSENSSVLDGRFTWNISGDGDACFDVVNSCDKTTLKYTTVWPNSEDNEAHVVFDKLPVDDKCEIQVSGLYGTTTQNYRTPSCDVFDCSPKEPIKPEIPSNISIVANEDSFDSWKVRVSWALPHIHPDFYNITLHTDPVQTEIIPGDATEVEFKDVTGEGFYNVSLRAKLGKITAVTSRQALFPSTWYDAADAGGVGGAGGVALGAGCAGAAALALLCRCRRRRHHVPVPHYKLDDKLPKDDETEVLEVWSETEDRWEVRVDKLVLHEVIGEGAFGVVRRATLAPHSTHVAVKMLKDYPSYEETRSFRAEMELMKSVGVHPHLVSLVGCCSGRRPLIITEYCSRGDLLSYLRCTWDEMISKRNANNNIDISDYRKDLSKSNTQIVDTKLAVNKLYDLHESSDKELTALELLSFCRQIAMGMEFLAANKVVHRDLAARNILVTAEGTLKVADFGLSRDVYEENQYKQKGNGKMPIKWMALESLTRRIYTTQSDVWSFGVVVWEIATVGGAPYASVPAARLPRLLRSGYRMPKPNNCSLHLYDIMLSCWRDRPRDRPTFAELHQRLDELMNSACADQYLSLELDADDTPPTPKHHSYLKMFIRGKRERKRGENYERPLKAPHSNHYTSAPDSVSSHPV